jgi:Predicted membrane protein (DUF2157)
MKDGKAWLSSEIPGLMEKGILPPESAAALRAYYKLDEHPGQAQRLAVIVCTILGGTLIGAGIILLIAHNWDDMGRPARTVLSFLPLAVACLLSGRAIARNPPSAALNEGGGIFHVLSIGAAISLISQTYHISGDFSAFVLTWSLLALPLVYLLRSTSVAVLYLIGITVWAGSRMDGHAEMLWYWPLLAAAIPFYGGLLKENRVSLRANWLSLALAASVPVALGFQCGGILEQTWPLAFGGYFAVLYLVDRQWFSRESSSRFIHPFRAIGATGIAVLAITMSYREIWRMHPFSRDPEISTATYGMAYGLSYGLVLAAAALMLFCRQKKTDFNFVAAVLPLAALAACLLAQHRQGTAVIVLVNGFAALLALGTIIRGFQHNRLGTLNAGMVVAAALIVARFFDSELSFVVRGVAFILIGTGFLAANWILLKNRKTASP